VCTLAVAFYITPLVFKCRQSLNLANRFLRLCLGR